MLWGLPVRGRTYAAHRRAYFPRLSVVLVPTSITTAAIVSYLRPPVLIAALGGGLIGIVVMQLRLMLWRRRNPIISVEQYAADWREAMRRAARWN
jgi:hypothetical protein